MRKNLYSLLYMLLLLFILSSSFYLTAHNCAASEEIIKETDSSNIFVIGVILADDGGKIVVRGTIENSPASRTGIQKGDILIKIDEREAGKLTFQEALDSLRGFNEEPVKLLIDRGGHQFGLSVPKEPLNDILLRVGLQSEGNAWIPLNESLPPEIGKAAPPLQGIDCLTSTPVKFDDLKGHYLLISFWASWCSFCHDEITFLKKAHHDYSKKKLKRVLKEKGNKQIIVVAVSLDDDRQAFEHFIHNHRFATVQIFDGGWFGVNSRAYHAYNHGVPWNVLIDPEGKIKAWDLRGSELIKALSDLK